MTTTETVAPNRFADMFGYPKGRAVTKLKDAMTPFIQEFIQHAPFCVFRPAIATDAVMPRRKGARRVLYASSDERRLLLPDVAGNKLFQSYQNMDSNPRVALLFFIPGVNETVA